MRVIFTGGGTGGHILPNVAIIEALRARNSFANEFRASDVRHGASGHERGRGSSDKLQVLYIGEKNSLEQRIAQEHGIPFRGITAGKLRRYFDIKNLLDLFRVPVGVMQAYRILRKEKPALVFAKGGYVSVPVVLAAKLCGIPVWIHESDMSPGLSTRICARFASEIWLSFEESRAHFSHRLIGAGPSRKKRTIHVVGNPIRSSLLSGDPTIGYKLTGFSADRPVTLVMGGSIGAQFLNEFVHKNLTQLLKFTQVVHLTGPAASARREREAREDLASPVRTKLSLKIGVGPKINGYALFEFLNEDLAHIYAITNLAVSRAGAGSIFELLALHKPMILIPLPKSASRGDQIENAEVFAKNGWAISVDQDRVSSADLLNKIRQFATDHAAMNRVTARHKKAGANAAAQKIADAILHL